jgi:hypothetical protein
MITRHTPLALLLLATAGATLGCYESDVALGPPANAIDARLVGRWRCASPDSSQASNQLLQLNVARRNERQYDVSLDTPGEETIRYQGHGIDVRGTTIVNLQEVKPGQDLAGARWNFVRATLLKPNVLDVQIVDDDLFKDKPRTAEAQRVVFEANVGKPELYFDYCVCVRVVTSSDRAPR